MRIKSLLLGLTIVSACQGQGLMSKMIGKLAKTMGNSSAAVATSLDEVALAVTHQSNLNPAELGTISQTMFKGWQTGGEFTFIMLTQKNGTGYCKLDGTATLDGKPMEFSTMGYALITPENPAPKTIELTTKSGQKSSFTIEPFKKIIKIKSVNGQTDPNVSLDLTKDVVIEFETLDVNPGSLLKVSLAINQINIKSFYEVCYIKPSAKITIPAAAFRNMNIKPASASLSNRDEVDQEPKTLKGMYGFKNSYITVGVEDIKNATNVQGSFKDVTCRRIYEDGRFVNVTSEPDLNTGLIAKGEEKFDNGPFKYKFQKPGAFLSRNAEQITKIGISSFAIRGTTFSENTTSNQFYIKTTTMEFPQQSDETWNALLDKMYPQFVAVLEQQLAPVLPLEKLTSTAAYNQATAYSSDDKNTKVHFAKSYNNTKVISAFVPIAEGYGVNSINERIMKEAGVNALMNITIDLQMEADKDGAILMCPRLGFELSGSTNGNISNTKYYTGLIVGKGIPFNEKMAKDELDKVIRASDLIATFAKALKEIKEKEKVNGDYPTVWNLQK